MSEGRSRLIVAMLVGNLALTLAVVGWAAWAATDPEYWFPGAFAEEGPRGDEGPRGERGPRGPEGPVGPGVEDVQNTADEALAGVDDVQTQLDDVSSRVDNLEGVDTYDLESRVSDLESQMDEVCSTLDFDLDLYVC